MKKWVQRIVDSALKNIKVFYLISDLLHSDKTLKHFKRIGIKENPFMKEKNLPEEVVSFISKNIRLYQDLKALIFLFRNKKRYFNIREVAEESHTLMLTAAQSLLRLHSSNLIFEIKRVEELQYSYNIHNEYNYLITEFLDSLYDENKVELMILILSQPYTETTQTYIL